MLPVVAMWGHLCGFDITATTAMPDAVRTGFARSLQMSAGVFLGHGHNRKQVLKHLMDGVSRHVMINQSPDLTLG